MRSLRKEDTQSLSRSLAPVILGRARAQLHWLYTGVRRASAGHRPYQQHRAHGWSGAGPGKPIMTSYEINPSSLLFTGSTPRGKPVSLPFRLPSPALCRPPYRRSAVNLLCRDWCPFERGAPTVRGQASRYKIGVDTCGAQRWRRHNPPRRRPQKPCYQ